MVINGLNLTGCWELSVCREYPTNYLKLPVVCLVLFVIYEALKTWAGGGEWGIISATCKHQKKTGLQLAHSPADFPTIVYSTGLSTIEDLCFADAKGTYYWCCTITKEHEKRHVPAPKSLQFRF